MNEIFNVQIKGNQQYWGKLSVHVKNLSSTLYGLVFHHARHQNCEASSLTCSRHTSHQLIFDLIHPQSVSLKTQIYLDGSVDSIC